MGGALSQASMAKVMAAHIGRYVRDIPATPSVIVSTYFFSRATTTYSWAFWNTKAVKTM